MRQTPATSTTAIDALLCDDDACSHAADDVQAFITGNVANNLEKRFCMSCKRNLDATTYFLENRKTCTTCLTKHKLYIREKTTEATLGE